MKTAASDSRDDIESRLGIGGQPDAKRGWKHGFRLPSSWTSGWTGLALLLVVVFAILLRKCSTDDVQARYVTEPLTRGNLTLSVSATGILQPTHTVDVGTEVSGTIASVNVDFNDQVEVGQILAQLDTSKLSAQVLQGEAALAAAKARISQATEVERQAAAEWTRIKTLSDRDADIVSAQALDAAKANRDRARADTAAAIATANQSQALLDAQRTELAKATIRSPIKGVVLNRAVDPGQTVAANFQSPVLFRLAEDLTRMELQADIDEADVGLVREGQSATFTVDAFPDRPFPARITQLRYGAQVVEGVVTYKAILTVDNTDRLLRPGMTATAQIVVEDIHDALLVPNAALRFAPADSDKPAASGGLMRRMFPRPTASMLGGGTPVAASKDHLWVLSERGVPVAVPVVIGASDGERSVIESGDLQAGTAVIVDEMAKP